MHIPIDSHVHMMVTHKMSPHSGLYFRCLITCTFIDTHVHMMVTHIAPHGSMFAHCTYVSSTLTNCSDEMATTFSVKDVSRRPHLGSIVRQKDNDEQMTFTLKEGYTRSPITLALTSFEAGGVGAQVWDASIALSIFLASKKAPSLPERPKVLELGAGIALPSFSLLNRADTVTVTDARPALLELCEANLKRRTAQATPQEPPLAKVHVTPLQWGDLQWGGETDGFPETNTSAATAVDPPPEMVGYDMVIGSDVCYDESQVESLAVMIEALKASVTVLIGPSTRPSMRLLARRVEAMGGHMRVQMHRLTLVSRDASAVAEEEAAWEEAKAEEEEEQEEGRRQMRSGGVHLVFVITREDKG